MTIANVLRPGESAKSNRGRSGGAGSGAGGVKREAARMQIGEYLDRFDLAAYKNKKIKELSKGMQQKAQIIATLMGECEAALSKR